MADAAGRGVRWEAAGATDVGLIREANEDAWLVTPDLILVADGLGGHAGGEVASRIAVEVVRAALTSERSPDALVAAVRRAHAAIHERARDEPALTGMATTLTGLARLGDGLVVLNVGDSRTYRLLPAPAEGAATAGDPADIRLGGDSRLGGARPGGVGRLGGGAGPGDGAAPGRLVQLTRDDSLVGELVAAGLLTREQARIHPHRNIITVALGLDADELPVSVHRIPQPGGRYLACSDGLTDPVSDADIATILAAGLAPDATAHALVEAALSAGGPDNVTVVVADVFA